MKTYTLKLTGAVAVDGLLKRAGSIVEVDELTARNLLHRGKAKAVDAAPAADEPEAASDGKKPSEGLNIAELREALAARGIAIPDGAKKSDLAELLDAAPAA